MLSIILVLALGGGDAVAEAGASYRAAREAIDADHPEQAVELLRTAIQQMGEENEQLKYRDDTSRRRHSYYPYYELGRARMMQVRTEASVFTQRDLLQDAVNRLGQSKHPMAPQLLEEAKAKLTDVAEIIKLDSSFNAAKTAIEVLGSAERFEEAFDQHQEASTKYKARIKELEEVRVNLVQKQAAAVKRYDTLLSQRLNELVLMDVVTRGDTIIPLLTAALVPPEVKKQDGPQFEWARRFMALWKKEQPTVVKAATLPGPTVIATAEAFDAAGLEALKLNLPAGLRAARHLAQTTRLGKLREIALGSEDVLDIATADAVVKSSVDASKRSTQASSGQGDKDVKDTLLMDIGTQEKQVNDLATTITKASKERARLTAPIVTAEGQLLDGDLLGDEIELNKVKNNLFELESDGSFGTLTPRLRARALFAHAIAEGMLACLEGKNFADTVDRARVPGWRAYGFDPKVEERWSARISPKLQKVFDAIKPK